MGFRNELKWWEKIYYPIKRKVDAIIEFPYVVKAFWQRGRRGWADRDTWSFDYYIADVIHDALKHLAKTSHGCPSDFAKCPYEGDNKLEDYKYSKEICEKCKKETPSKNGYNELDKCPMCDSWYEKLHEIADGFKRYKELVLDDGLNKMLYEDKGRRLEWETDEIKCVPTEIAPEEWEEYKKALAEEHEKFQKVVADFGRYFGNLWD